MERTITVRSSALDSWIKRFRKIERDKESKLGITVPLVSSILITPSLDQHKLGYFRPDSLLIAISEDLVENGTESEIENVFLHELSHALDYRISRSLEHGQSFRRCCRLLGVDEGFDKSRIQLSIGRMNSKREKIKKLMALSSSPFENESAAAIQKAKKLMAENEIGEKEDERIYTAPLYSAGKFSYGMKLLLSYVEKSSGIFLITAHEGKEKRALAYGSLEEVEFALYLFDYLLSSTDSAIKALRSDGEKVSRDNFIMGMIDILTSRTSGHSTDTALIAIQNKNKETVKRIVYPEERFVHKSSVSYIYFDEGSYGHGKGFAGSLDVPHRVERKAIQS